MTRTTVQDFLLEGLELLVRSQEDIPDIADGRSSDQDIVYLIGHAEGLAAQTRGIPAQEIERLMPLLAPYLDRFNDKSCAVDFVGAYLNGLIRRCDGDTITLDMKAIKAPFDSLSFIGRLNDGKHIIINGDAGMDTGLGMRQGRITIRGDVTSWKGAIGEGMEGGAIYVDGSVDHEGYGAIRNGEIHVAGDTGDYADIASVIGSGKLFHRGTLVVDGERVIAP